MTPLEPHAPPRAAGALHKLRTTPVLTSRVFNLPSVKKATLPLSGDQNGLIAPCAPPSTRSAPVRRDRSHNSPPAPKTSELPSGESAGCVPMSPSISNEVPTGGMIDEKTGSAATAVSGRRTKNAPSAASKAIPASDQASSSRGFFRRVTGIATADACNDEGSLEDIDFSSRDRSRADCHRSSGSFARQRRTT